MSGPALDRVLDALANAGRTAKPNGNGYIAQCPTHGDTNPSLSIGNGHGKVVLSCKAGCPTEQVINDLDLTWDDLFDDPRRDSPTAPKARPRVTHVYDYVAADGALQFQKLRYEPKTFHVRVPDGNGGWNWRIGDATRVLYRLPEVLTAINAGKTIYIVEGEKDADRLASLGYTATCNFDGAGEAKWAEEYSVTLTGAHVVVIADNDGPGYLHAESVAEKLADHAESVQMVRVIPEHHGADLSDHLDAGHSVDDLQPITSRPVTAETDSPDFLADVDREVRRLKVHAAAKRAFQEAQTEDVDLPEPTLLTTLLAEEPSPVQYRIDKLLPAGGRVVLAAQYKAGKTTMTGNLVRCLADGADFLGCYPTSSPAGNIVVIDNEMPRDTIRGWLKAQGIANQDKVAVIPTRGHIGSFNVINEVVRQRWIDLLTKYEPGVIILDCLRPVLDALNLDENTEAGQVLVALDAITEATGAKELIVVHHMGHVGERARGSSRIRDWPDVEWRLVRKESDNPASERYFMAYGRDVDIPETALTYDPVTRHLTLGTGSRQEAAAQALVPDLVDLLVDQPGLSGRALEDRMMDAGIPRGTIRLAVAVAVEAGKVVTVPGPKRSIKHYPAPTSAPVRRSAPSAQPRTAGASAPVRPLRGTAAHSSGALDLAVATEPVGALFDVEEERR